MKYLHAMKMRSLIRCIGSKYRMRRELYIKFLLGVCMFVLFRIYFLNANIETLIAFVPIPFTNYKQILTNARTLDTYHRRLLRFLKKRNISVLSYELARTTNDQLLNDTITEIVRLQSSQYKQLLDIKNGEEVQRRCQQTCCWARRKMKPFYDGENHRSPTVLDRLSQIDMKLLADLHYGNLPVPGEVDLLKLTDDVIPCLHDNTVIFVDTTDIGYFLKAIHVKIRVNYILITGDSDVPCPLNINQEHSEHLDEIFAGRSQIIHWFAMNCDLGNNEEWKKSNIFSCIPQGISQWYDQRYYMQLASGKDDSIYNTDLKTDKYWILTAFPKKYESKIQKSAWKLSCKGRLKSISKCLYRSNATDLWKYYSIVGRSKFVFSPPGFGIDSYGTWEALYLGSIPIIINSTLNEIFQDLPVLIVNNYEEITLELLKAVYDNMTKQTYNYRRLYKGYWQRKINYYRDSIETIQFHYSE